MLIFASPAEHNPFLKFPTAVSLAATGGTGADISGFPASNLLTYDPTSVAKSNSGQTQIQIDYGTVRVLNVFSLLHCDVSPRCTLTILASNDGTNFTQLSTGPFWAHLSAVPGAPPYTEQTSPYKGAKYRNHSFFYSPTDLNYRFVRFVINDPDQSSLSFGRLFCGKAFHPASNYQYGSGFKFDDTAKRERTDQGALIIDGGKVIVSATVKMDFLSTNEMYDYIYDFNYFRGSGKEFFCCLDYTAAGKNRLQKNMLYCTMTDGRSVEAAQFEAWSQTWILESI